MLWALLGVLAAGCCALQVWWVVCRVHARMRRRGAAKRVPPRHPLPCFGRQLAVMGLDMEHRPCCQAGLGAVVLCSSAHLPSDTADASGARCLGLPALGDGASLTGCCKTPARTQQQSPIMLMM